MTGIINIKSGSLLTIQSGGVLSTGPLPPQPLWGGYDGSNNGASNNLGALGTSGILRFFSLPIMDTDKVMLGYFGSGESSFPRAIIASRSGDTVSVGSSLLLNSINTSSNRFGIAGSDTNRAIAYYRNGDASDGKVLTVSGTTISSAGTTFGVIGSGRPNNLEMAQIDTNRHIITWNTSTGGFETRVHAATNTGGTITSGGTGNLIFTNHVANDNSSAKLDSTRIINAYRQSLSGQPDSNDIFIQVHENTSGTTISSGTPVKIEESGNNTEKMLCVIPITANAAAVIYGGSVPDKTFIQFYSINGTTLTAEGGEQTLDNKFWSGKNPSESTFNCTKLTETEFMVSYITNSGGILDWVSRVITFPTTTTFSLGSEVLLLPSGTFANERVIQTLNSTTVLALYTENTSTDTARAIVINV